MRMNAYIYIRFALIHIVHDHTCAHSLCSCTFMAEPFMHIFMCIFMCIRTCVRKQSLANNGGHPSPILRQRDSLRLMQAHDWLIFLPSQFDHD